MFEKTKSPKSFILVAPFIMVSLTSQLSHADIFKWKDSHGVTQYSDAPPVSSAVKANRHEVVNALQKKDLCVEPVAKKLVNFTSEESINFLNTSFSGNLSNGNLGKNSISGVNRSNVQARTSNPFGTAITTAKNNTKLATNTSKSIRTAYNPFKQNAALTIGNQKVSVFNASFKVRGNSSPISAANPFTSSNPGTLTGTNSTANPTPLNPVASTTPTSATPAAVPVVLAALPTSSGVVIPSSKAPPVSSTPPVSSSPPVSSAPPVISPLPVTPPASSTPTGSGVVQKDLMPAVDIVKNMAPVAGFADLRIRPIMGDFDIPPVGDGNGQFRIDCGVSHMNNDDPLVYPNQQGAAHHHTFFGNTSINFKSNLATLSTTGNSTCRGGIANRSAYWVPSMIDSATSTPLKPYSSLWYYKTGYAIPKEKITPPPKGLRIVTGNMKANSSATSRNISFTCFKEGNASPAATTYIPACPQTWTIVTHVGFPQCWDGKNLDSPDHISHMANSVGSSCPVTHPVAIPHLGLNVKYLITDPEGTKNWRLSSDNYAKNGYNSGYSSHADWVSGWDDNVIAGIVKNCLNAGKDCGNHMLGDGTVIYAENVSWR